MEFKAGCLCLRENPRPIGDEIRLLRGGMQDELKPLVNGGGLEPVGKRCSLLF